MKNFLYYFADAFLIVTGALMLMLPVSFVVFLVIEYKWTAVLCIAAFLTAVIGVAFILKKKDKLRKEKERQALK